MREGAGRLAGPHRRVDPPFVEEAPGDIGHARRKGAIGVEHHVTRSLPLIDAPRRVRQRGVAVPVVEPRLAEPAGFERVIAMRKARIGVRHRRNQRLDNLGLDPIGEMARIGDVLEFAPAIGGLLVLGQRAGDEGEETQVGAERLGERVGRRFPGLRVRILQFAEQRLERQALAFKVEPQRRHRVVEQPVPGGRGADRLVQEQSFEVVGKLMRLLLADVLEPGAVMAKRRRRHGGVQFGVVDAIELELEEQEIAGERGHAFLRVAMELRDYRIAGVGGVEQRRVGHDAAGQILQRLVGLDRRGQRLARVGPVGQLAELAAIGFGEQPWLPARRARNRRRSAASPCLRTNPEGATPAARPDPPEQPTARRRRRGNGT